MTLFEIVDEVLVVPVVIRLIIEIGGQYQTDRSGGKVVHLAPDHRANIEAIIGSVKMVSLLLLPIIEYHVETTRHGDDELMEVLVSMTSSLRPAWDIVQIIDPLDIEWYVALTFDEGQISPRFSDFGELNNFAMF
jgi:hypothetical protein